MTTSPSRNCKHPMCTALVPATEPPWCPVHRRTVQVARAQHDRRRGSAAERGYDAEWQRYRISDFLPKWPLCLGVLIPDMMVWSRVAAQDFHALREAQRELGNVTSYGGAVLAFLAKFPIYRLEPWDVTKPAVVVDHIIPHKGDYELMWSPWNHQPLTKRAHDRKTATEKKR